jgi:hypothetical protein
VFAAVDDVAGKFSQAKGDFASEIEKSTDEKEETADEDEESAEFAEGVHKRIVADSILFGREQTKRDSSTPQAGVRAARTQEKTGLLRPE